MNTKHEINRIFKPNYRFLLIHIIIFFSFIITILLKPGIYIILILPSIIIIAFSLVISFHIKEITINGNEMILEIALYKIKRKIELNDIKSLIVIDDPIRGFDHLIIKCDNEKHYIYGYGTREYKTLKKLLTETYS